MVVAATRELILREFQCEEYDHFGKAAYRIPPKRKGGRPGRTFITLWIDEGHAVLMLSIPLQQEIMDEHPEKFVPHPSKWGAKGATIALLEQLDEKLFQHAVSLAYAHASR